MQRHRLYILSLLSLGISTHAYGYIDPGVGSMIVQGLLAGGAGVLFFIRLFWGKIKAILVRQNTIQKRAEPK